MKKFLLIIIIAIVALPAFINAQTCGTTNIALGQPVNVSGQQQYHEGSTAVDGNLSTAWFTASGDTNYIYVDLGQSYTICKMKLYWSTDGRGKSYKAQVSANATTWTDMVTRTNNTATTDSFTTSGTGRYVRLYLTARVNTWANYELFEIVINNTLSNTKPSVRLTTPANNATYYAGANIVLEAAATDPDGSVSKVEFYQGATKLGEATTEPYTYTWSNVPAGSYAVTAKAYDNSTADSTSTTVNIVVNNSNRWSLTGNTGTNPDSNFVGTVDNKRLSFRTNNTEKMTILADGFVGIGTATAPNAEAKLGVNGAIYAKKLKVTQTGWADYVFEPAYKLMSLPELEVYIKKHQHLPGVATTAEVEKNGTDVGEIQATLLKKIEELTLYVIALQKQVEELKKSSK